MDENIWEQFAGRAPKNYILTGDIDYGTDVGPDRFYQTGKEFTEQTLGDVNGLLPGKENALEIGSGIGRLTLPHAEEFSQVTAVDISPTMLGHLEQRASGAGHNNIRTFLPQGEWDEISYDYVFSFLVFQHIEHLDDIKSYMERISASLKPGGVAHLHFDTRAAGSLYHIRNFMPDWLLPRTQRKGIRRIRRDADELRNLFIMNNLRIIREKWPNSERHVFILSK